VEPKAHSPAEPRSRAFLVGLAVRHPELRGARAVAPSNPHVERVRATLSPAEFAILATVTDDELAAMRSEVEEQFVAVFPASI
jgi:hypothetical protein